MYENFIAFDTSQECSFFNLEVVKSAFFKFIAMEIFVRSITGHLHSTLLQDYQTLHFTFLEQLNGTLT